ncbi:MAG: tetratricopeptide repeat protein [Candidatus Omnitrophota bacterium]
MRQKPGFIALFAAGFILLSAFPGQAAPPPVATDRPPTARGVACYIMGYNAELMGVMDEAADYYERAVREDGSSKAARLRLAAALAQLERYAEAQREVLAAEAIDPADLTSHYLAALLYSQQKLEDKASVEYELIFKTLAERNPSSGEFPRYLGQLYYSRGLDEKAMEQFAAALKLEPKNTALLYILGTYYLNGSRRAEGLGLVKQCLSLEPSNADCLNSLAYAYAEDNINLDEALAHVNAALKAEPDNAAYLDTRGWLYYRQGQYPQALKELMRADSLLKDPEILGHIAEVYLKLGSPEEARKYQQLQQEQVLNAKSNKAR